MLANDGKVEHRDFPQILFFWGACPNTDIYNIGPQNQYEPSFDYNSTQKGPFSINKYRRNLLDEIYILAVSRPDVKHFEAFVPKAASDLGFAGTSFSRIFGTCGTVFHSKYAPNTLTRMPPTQYPLSGKAAPPPNSRDAFPSLQQGADPLAQGDPGNPRVPKGT